MIRRAKTLESFLEVLIPLERTYTRPAAHRAIAHGSSLKMNGATSS